MPWRPPLRAQYGWLLPAILLIVVILPLQPLVLRSGFTANAASRTLRAALDEVTSTPVDVVTTTPTGTTAPTPGVTAPVTPTAEPAGPPHYVVMIVIDGNRPSYFDLASLPHLRALMDRGVVYDRAWVGEMESSTPNVHVTFGTGTLPRENGFMGFGWAAEQTRKMVDFRTLLANGQIDPVLRALPTLSVTRHLHQVDPKAVSVAGSGHKDYAVVGLGGGAATYELYGKFIGNQIVPNFIPSHTPPPLTSAERKNLTRHIPLKRGAEDQYAFDYAIDVARHVKPRLLMLNLPEADTWGHWYGPATGSVFAALMKNIDTNFGRLEETYRKMGILDQTDFIITADHSMMQSRAAQSWPVLFQAARDLKDPVVRADGEGGGVWLQDPTRAKEVATHLVQLRPAHVEAIFYRSGPGMNFHYLQASPTNWLINSDVATALRNLVDTTAGRNGPDMWVLYRENWTVVSRNVTGKWKGTHGGATWNVQHIGMIMAGPGIRQHVHSQFPARAIDVAPTMEYLLGLPPIAREGVVLADALTDAGPGLAAAQGAIAPSLNVQVTAIQQQSTADSRSLNGWHPPPTTVHCDPARPAEDPCVIDPSTATNQ